jgi:hypothetical protein
MNGLNERLTNPMLPQVRSVPVTVHPAELSALNVKPPKVDTIRTTEASLRLDAVASAGLRMPRSKCAAAIAAGCVLTFARGFDGEQQSVATPQAAKEDGLVHPADTSRSNLAAALGRFSRWRLSKPYTGTPYSLTRGASRLTGGGMRGTLTCYSDVKVNWREVTKASKDVKQGDIISCRGKGRLEIGSVSMNSKGRYSVEMTRYV